MAKKKGVSSEKAKAKEAKKAKAEKKAEKRETKKTKGGSARPGADDEEDLDAILEKLAKEWEAKHKVNEETVAGPPTRRANATLTPCPSGNHLWFIGGEYFSEDGKAHFYNDVYRYTPEKLILSGAGNTFHHYRDFWVFDVATHSWDRIETKIKPIARSGHRMALWKHFIVLFGGFVDIGVRTNYLNDLWLFDTQEYKWIQVEFGPNDRQPHSRSGFSFLPIAEGVIMHGGYTKTYDKGKRPVGVALEDTWFLKSVSRLHSGDPPLTLLLRMSLNPKEIKWEKRKKIGYAPSPARSGCSMALWAAKAQGVLFGGVSDVDKDEEQLDSVFYNDMFGYQTSGNGRWVSMNLKKKKKMGGQKKEKGKNPAELRKYVEEEEEEPLSDDEANPAATPMSPAEPTPQSIFAMSDDPDQPPMPFQRYNAMLAVLRNTLYMCESLKIL
ncbi:hypothetical protein FRC00_001795 [Tulasnella sp. 408]|nr:hypothetical protein FRC00_001795 [Tulasnella sp. 408]